MEWWTNWPLTSPEPSPVCAAFTRANLFRMRQFYQTYRREEKVAPLVRQLPWTHNLIILGQSRRPEEREFYVRLAIQERLEPSRAGTPNQGGAL